MERISPQLFYQYLTCPNWIWFDRFGDPEKKHDEPNEMQQTLLEQGIAFEKEYMAREFADKTVTTIVAHDWDAGVSATKKAMKAGAEIIYQGYLRTEYYQGKPDLLFRREYTKSDKKSKYVNYYYEPVDIKSGSDLKEEYKYQLMLYALALADIQGYEPPDAGVITSTGELVKFRTDSFREKFYACLGKIEKILGGEKPPMQLTKACTNSPWYDCCVEEAEATDDIALLYKVDKRALGALRDFGVKTVEDARKIDPEAFGDSIPFLKKNGLERMKMQAESLKTKEIFTRRAPKLPTAEFEIYFDIEGDPLHNVEYLFGFLISENGRDVYKPFLAERPADEEKMWREFLNWIGSSDMRTKDYIVYHYAPYESTRLTTLSDRYKAGMSDADRLAIVQFRARMFDLNDIVKEDFIFPLYFYGLKQICKLLGFSWRSKKAGGAQSIFWYEEWLKTGDREILDTVVQYNEDDVLATKFLRDWIHIKE
ncbi:MAG: TM0106 family RecB-like putative nuclease [Candidatus Magasanikbacteria bacterium]|nr:TM0106 family RecB-like putative nuclease [Candidatus Magasanikbacteria bacterium]